MHNIKFFFAWDDHIKVNNDFYMCIESYAVDTIFGWNSVLLCVLIYLCVKRFFYVRYF